MAFHTSIELQYDVDGALRDVWYGRLNWSCLVGVSGFEPPAPASRRQCSTRLSYTPTCGNRLGCLACGTSLTVQARRWRPAADLSHHDTPVLTSCQAVRPCRSGASARAAPDRVSPRLSYTPTCGNRLGCLACGTSLTAQARRWRPAAESFPV